MLEQKQTENATKKIKLFFKNRLFIKVVETPLNEKVTEVLISPKPCDLPMPMENMNTYISQGKHFHSPDSYNAFVSRRERSTRVPCAPCATYLTPLSHSAKRTTTCFPPHALISLVLNLSDGSCRAWLFSSTPLASSSIAHQNLACKPPWSPIPRAKPTPDAAKQGALLHACARPHWTAAAAETCHQQCNRGDDR